MSKAGLVRLNAEQMTAIHNIREQERVNSTLGTAPSINAIARALIDKGLANCKQVLACGKLI